MHQNQANQNLVEVVIFILEKVKNPNTTNNIFTNTQNSLLLAQN